MPGNEVPLEPLRRKAMAMVGCCRQAATALVVGLFYFGVLLFTALPHGLATIDAQTLSPAGSYRVGPIGPWTDTEAWIEAFGPTDPASYARAGREIATAGWVQTRFYDIAWPPGEYLVHAALLRCHLPVPLSLIVLTCGLWSCALVQCFCFARRRLPFLVALALPLTVLATELFRHFCLRGWGPYLSEGPSCPLLVLGFGCLVYALEPLVWPAASRCSNLLRTLGAGCGSGLFFALGAYLRAQVELILALLLPFCAAVALVTIVRAARHSGLRPRAFLRSLCAAWWRSGLLALCVVLASFHACTLPYRIYHNHRKYGYWEWTSGYAFIWPLMWRDPATVPAEGEFFVQGGGQAPAIVAADWHIDAARLTEEEGRALTLKVLRERPGAWLRYKLPILGRYWFSRNCAAGMANAGYAYGENGTILLCLLVVVVGCMAALLRGRCRGVALSLLILTGCVALAGSGPPLLFHFEVRYLHPVKVFAVVALPYLVPLTLQPRRSRTCSAGGVL
jgi:hypothetical protein